MKLKMGLGLAFLFTVTLVSGCKTNVVELLSAQPASSIPQGSGGNGTPNAAPTLAPTHPWTTVTGSSGTTSYRAKGSVTNVNYGFIEYLPAGYSAATAAYYPIVIFLHGTGERGDGSAAALANYRNNSGSAAGPQYNIDHGKYYNAVVITPQCESNGWWNSSGLNNLLVHVLANYKVNPKRVLVTGLSMGGGGTWDFVGGYASKFAAAMPICPATDCGGNNAASAVTAGVKIWGFHAMDDWVPATGSQACMTKIGGALGQVGGFMDSYISGGPHQTAHFNNGTKRWVFESEVDCTDSAGNPWPIQICQTLYKDGGHGIWGNVYQHATDLPMTWLLNQSRP